MNKSKNLHTTLKLLVGLGVIMLLSTAHVHAIVWCHDYTFHRVTCEYGACENNNNTSPGDLRGRLKGLGYEPHPITNAAENPEYAQQYLKPGDVLILRDDHSGYVNQNGTIDHFIQVFGESGKVRDPNNLPRHPLPDNNIGGVYYADTLKEFLGRPSWKGPIGKLEVWRRTAEVISWNVLGSSHDMRGKIGKRMTYICPPNGHGFFVKGTDTYYDQSSICAAAVHAGRITIASGGRVTIESRPGLDFYQGSTRNGVTSKDYKKFTGHEVTGSFVFVGGAEVKGNDTKPGGNDNGAHRNQTNAAEINKLRQWVAYYENLINQWVEYRDKRVLPYYNDPKYYQWARTEYQKANQAISTSQQYKAYYENLLRQAGAQ